MTYIKSTLKYNISFKLDGEEIVFDCERHYSDTGDTYSTGVVAIEDGVYDKLKNLKQFKDLLKAGELLITTKEEMYGAANTLEAAEAKNKELEEENARLKEAVANTPSADEMKKLAEENANMKKMLEKLGGNKTSKGKAKDEAEGGF